MSLIYLGLTLSLIWLHLAALTAVAGPRIGSWSMGRAGAVLLIVLGGFFVEHFYGLGSLKGLWPFTAGTAVWVLWHQRKKLKDAGFWRAECVLLLAWGYGLAWKFAFPNIYPTSERVTNLYFITNYLSGDTLPPLDNWFPPYRFDFYYSLQHYGAALLGRLLQLTPGLTYNLSFALLMALPITLAWSFTQHFLQRRAARILVILALMLGGTGASLFNYLLVQPPEQANAQTLSHFVHDHMWGSARFVGNYDSRANTPLAQWLLDEPEAGFTPRDLPLENFGYQYYVGDYHPPLGGFFLLLLAITLMSSLHNGQAGTAPSVTHLQYALLGLSVPLTLAVNAWVFPLHTALVASWLLWQWRLNRKDPALLPHWPAVIAGGLAGLLLLHPFLSGFATRSLATPFRWVDTIDKTPLVPFALQAWPLLILLFVGTLIPKWRQLSLYWAVALSGLLLFSQLIYVDDPSGAHYERTNSVMKWWGWIWTAGIVTLGTLGLAADHRWIRWSAGLALAGTLVYGKTIADYWMAAGLGDAGRLTAHTVYTRDPATRDIFRYLAIAPKGIVLENSYADAYGDNAVYAAFANKPALLGWPSHLITWYGPVEEVWLRRDQIRAFYSGRLPHPRDWLLTHDVRYVVWSAKETGDPGIHDRIQQALMPDYDWIPFGRVGNRTVGLWIRRGV